MSDYDSLTLLVDMISAFSLFLYQADLLNAKKPRLLKSRLPANITLSVPL